MQRMLFEDFQALCPEVEFIFACLPEYMDAARDHPYIKEVVDSRTVNLNEYCIHYNTCVSIADRYEYLNAPFCLEHRSDIWAKYCGVELARHDMCFRLPRKGIEESRKKLRVLAGRAARTGQRVRTPGSEDEARRPLVLFAPVSKMAVKTLLPAQIEAVEEVTRDCDLIGLHNREITDLTRLGVPGVYQATLLEWMSYIAAADYVIAVDTAAFHMAGGLKKPLVGIFTFADGKAYGKHFDFVLVQKHRDNGWDCGPCFTFMNCPKCPKSLQKPCLTELSKAELQAGVGAMFKRWPWGYIPFGA